MHKDTAKLNEAGIKVAGISYDSVEILKAFSDKNTLSFPLLSDAGSKTIDAYGIRNKDMDGKLYGKKPLTGVPHPGTYLVDKGGVVRARLSLEKYQERHSTDALIEAANAAKAK